MFQLSGFCFAQESWSEVQGGKGFGALGLRAQGFRV